MVEACSSCGSLTLRRRHAPFEFQHDGRVVAIVADQSYCNTCGNISYIGEQIATHQLAIADKIRSLDELLSPGDLLRVRSKYGFSQTDMERLLSIGPKTWTRWERGKVVHTKSTDLVLRRMDEDPRFVRTLMAKKHVENLDASSYVAQSETMAIDLVMSELTRVWNTSRFELDFRSISNFIVKTYEMALKKDFSSVFDSKSIEGTVYTRVDIGLTSGTGTALAGKRGSLNNFCQPEHRSGWSQYGNIRPLSRFDYPPRPQVKLQELVS